MIDRRIFLASLLAGCGGAEDDSVPLRSAGRRRNTMATTKVVLYGDSTEADSRLLEFGVIPAQVIRDWFAANGYAFEVAVDAIGGSTAQSLLEGKDRVHLGTPFSETVRASGAQIVGFRYTGANEHREGYTLTQFQASLQALVDEALAIGAVVLLSTTNPPDPAQISAARVEYMTGAAEVIRSVRRQNARTVLCDQWTYAIESGRLATLDGLHPTIETNHYQERRQAARILAANDLLTTL